MSFKRHPTLFYSHVVRPCTVPPLGIYPSLVGYQTLPLIPPSSPQSLNSPFFNSLPPFLVAARWAWTPGGQGWCGHGGSRQRGAESIFTRQPLPVGDNVPASFPWRSTLKKSLNFQNDSCLSFQKKKGGKQSSFLIYTSQTESFNSLVAVHLTNKPHLSCKTFHLRPHTAAPTPSSLMSFVCLSSPITSPSHLAAEGRGQCPLSMPAARNDSNMRHTR